MKTGWVCLGGAQSADDEVLYKLATMSLSVLVSEAKYDICASPEILNADDSQCCQSALPIFHCCGFHGCWLPNKQLSLSMYAMFSGCHVSPGIHCVCCLANRIKHYTAAASLTIAFGHFL